MAEPNWLNQTPVISVKLISVLTEIKMSTIKKNPGNSTTGENDAQKLTC